MVLTEPSEALLQLTKTNPSKDVFYMQQTGEIFETYEYDVFSLFLKSTLGLTGRVSYSAYAARMSFYRLRQFQCEVTGKSGLDYFQAIESEQSEARTMHSRFPEQLKASVLKAVQWRKYLNYFMLCTRPYSLLSGALLQRLWGVWITSWKLFTTASKTATLRTRVRILSSAKVSSLFLSLIPSTFIGVFVDVQGDKYVCIVQ